MIGRDDEYLIAPIAVLPGQLVLGPRTDTPERRLLIGILTEAIWCLRGRATGLNNGAPRDRERRQALRWVLSDGSGEPFSFVDLCDYLALDIPKARSALLVEHAMSRSGLRKSRARRGPTRQKVQILF